MNQKISKPNYFNKALASFIDFILPLLCCLTFSLELNFFILFFAFRLISIYLFDSTIGMKICKLTFLNANEEGLSIKEKILASFFILFEGVDYYKISRVFN